MPSEIQQQLRDELLDTLGLPHFFYETEKVSWLRLGMLLKNYRYEDIIGCVEWLRSRLLQATSVTEIWREMPRYLHHIKAKQDATRWQF